MIVRGVVIGVSWWAGAAILTGLWIGWWYRPQIACRLALDDLEITGRDVRIRGASIDDPSVRPPWERLGGRDGNRAVMVVGFYTFSDPLLSSEIPPLYYMGCDYLKAHADRPLKTYLWESASWPTVATVLQLDDCYVAIRAGGGNDADFVAYSVGTGTFSPRYADNPPKELPTNRLPEGLLRRD